LPAVAKASSGKSNFLWN